MRSFVAVKHILRKRVLRRTPPPIESQAEKSWVIAAAESTISPPAFFLPNQLERVTGWAASTVHPRREMEGGYSVDHAATRGFLLTDAWLIDGTLYKGRACSYLQRRSSLWPRVRVEREIEHGAIYCTPGGNGFFAQWLMDDCVTYPLAVAEGFAVTTDQPVNFHTPGYEAWLGMKPDRMGAAYFREVVIFEDFGQNRHKRRPFSGHDRPAAFPCRSETASRRVHRARQHRARRLLRNEMEIAEHLRTRHGFRILDPTKADVPTLVATCAGARRVVGVEGSGLIHGILVLQPGGAILTLQPPNRFVGVYKHLADRDHQHFGFVVGVPEKGDFRIDPEEVERTLDLFPV